MEKRMSHVVHLNSRVTGTEKIASDKQTQRKKKLKSNVFPLLKNALGSMD